VVEIDRDTGRVDVLRYVAVDDCGIVLNPLLAKGQIHGGVAQGIAQALYEEVTFGEDGQPGSGKRVRRELDLASAEVRLAPPGDDDAVALTATTLACTHGPRWRLLLIGAGQLTQYLARMAQALDYAVVICDPREEYPDEPDLVGVERVRTMPDDTVVAFKPDGHTAIIALTHDPKLDDLALMEALNTEAFYVGAIGSRVNQAKRKERLKEHFGVSDEQLARLHGPVGLAIGARTPPEIAISVLAEMTAIRHGAKIGAERAPSDPAQAGCVV
jgi:xanthine dehydrogenase accessory factor